jgi:hypothetical protein
MADGRWPMAEGSDGGLAEKKPLVAGRFCGLTPNWKI